MSEKQTYKLKRSSNLRHVNLTIGNDSVPVDNSELIDEIVKKQTILAVNDIADWEKTKYRLACNAKSEVNSNQEACFTLRFNKYSDEFGVATDEWSESGLFLENDVLMNTRRFRSSFIRFSYFTTPHRETQKLVSYSNIPLQQTGEQKVEICPGDEGSFLYYWKSEEKLNTVDSRLHLKVEFISSADGNAYPLSQCWGSALFGFFPLDVWNEEMDYVTVVLDHVTRTFHFEALSYKFDLVSFLLATAAGATTYQGNLDLALSTLPQWIHPQTGEDNRWCEMELEVRNFESLPGLYSLAQEAFGTGTFPNPVPIMMRTGAPLPPPPTNLRTNVQVPVPTLPQQQTTTSFSVSPVPSNMSQVMTSQPKGVQRVYKRRRQMDPSYVPHGLIARYMGGTPLNPATPSNNL
jgi:hypothetical protein|tara:strand:- start:895 stop:2112 length:1218 start_codon:yes stop_codon:yes gene_type:complete